MRLSTCKKACETSASGFAKLVVVPDAYGACALNVTSWDGRHSERHRAYMKR